MSAVVGATATSVNPVEKVIQMLEGLQSKVVAEGTAEAKTYDTFACFCKDQSKAKNAAIEDNTNQIATLVADMGTQKAERDAQQANIEAAQEELASLRADKKAVQAKAKKRKEKYAVEIQDMTGAVKALEEAIDVLKAGDTTSLISMKSTLRTAGVMAQAMGLGNKMLMQLSDIPEVPVSDYDFHSNDIIDTLKELLGEFRKTKERVDSDEVAAAAETTSELQGLADSIAGQTKDLKDATAAHGAAREAIGAISGDWTIATATLHDDQNYLKDLTDKCNKKSDLWDQRVQMRQDELVALTGALDALKGTVTDNNDRTVRLMQEDTEFVQTKSTSVRVHHARKMLNKPVEKLSVRGFLQARDPREMVAEMLSNKAESLHSAVLASMATQVADNPRFKKITQLIEDMILKLQKEADEEETHNGFCVKQTKLAEDKRDMKAASIAKLNGALAKSEAKRDKLTENIEKLEAEIADLEESLAKQTKIRGEEKAENASVIEDAKAGNEGVKKAIEIIDRFYKTAKNKTSFAQKQGPTADDIPDAGFDEEYGASQDDSVGILGMLEVIQSDFERTVSETEKTEDEQAAAFLEFETTTKSSLAEKNNAKDNYNTELTATKDSISNDTETMANDQHSFDNSIAELIKLDDACNKGNTMSFEERTAAREAEIAALKDAYSTLDAYKPE